MKIVIAPDSFKDSISARNAAQAIAKGFSEVLGERAETVCLPIADGGEGTLETLVPERDRTSVRVTGPLFASVDAVYGCIGETAVVEMATAAGLMLLSPESRSAGKTTTYGVGELILHAVADGCKRILLTVGGSATNDGGCGMLSALGAVFFDRNGAEFIPTGETLGQIARIETETLKNRLANVEFLIATDVKNPLLGETGATRVYGKQKGATELELDEIEEGMKHYASLLQALCGRDVAAIPGSGAGGGISVPLLAFTNACIQSGIETVLEVNRFSQALDGADLVITGEGKTDRQSLFGKAISGVSRMARAKGIPVVLFVGALAMSRDELAEMGISDALEARSLASSIEDSIQNAETYLCELARRLARTLL